MTSAEIDAWIAAALERVATAIAAEGLAYDADEAVTIVQAALNRVARELRGPTPAAEPDRGPSVHHSKSRTENYLP